MRYLIFACLLACGSKSTAPTEPATPTTPPPPEPGAVAAECTVTGCSGSICAKPGYDVVTTCEMKPEYQCYAGAECKVQASGECGWTMDDRLQRCLASPPPLQ
jgi:hypothetical protein